MSTGLRPLVAGALVAASLASPQASATRTLEAGPSHNLALTASGQVLAWGENSRGMLGNGTRVSSSTPVRAGTLTGIVAVAAGDEYSIALRNDETVWTWGGGPLGRSADEVCFTQPCDTTPGQVPNLVGVTAIAAGRSFVLALLRNGTVRAWGENSCGELGIGSTVAQASPVSVPNLNNVVAIAAGENHAVALKADGTLVAWGKNQYGELGALVPNTPANTCADSGIAAARSPVPVVTSGSGSVFGNVQEISARGHHTLARRGDRSLWAWGSNYYGQIGDGTATDARFPAAVPGMSNIASFSAGESHSLAIKGDGSYWAWGLDLSGQLGLGTTAETCPAQLSTRYMLPPPWPCRRSPGSSGARSGLAAIVGGGAHTLALRPDGTIDAYGLNNFGQLGVPAVRTLLPATCYASPHRCPGFPVGVAGSGVSIGRASTSGGLNVNSLAEGLVFEARAVGTVSGEQQVVVTNLASPFRITGVEVSGDFRQTSNCPGVSLAQGATCVVSITFAPTAPGTRAGVLTVSTDIAASPQATLAMSGTATGTAFPLTITKSGTGTGSVTSFPSGIDCGAICSASFSGTVALSAIPTGGSAFTGWSGACTGVGTCSVSMSAARAVTATFTAAPSAATLTITRLGSGTGTVTSTPAGIQCGATCSAPFGIGTAVTLAATPAAGSTFAGWSGACSGSGACSITMNGPATLGASFNASGVAAPNYTALWWNRNEPGWGINLTHQGNLLFATLFNYDAAGAPLWLVMSGGVQQADGSFRGELYRTTGAAFNTTPFPPATSVTPVGTMTLVFTSANAATLSYSVNGAMVTKAIERQVYGSRAANCAATTADRINLTNYQDLWWTQGESGWGINVTHQDQTLFATLFTYAADGRGMWLVMSTGARQADGSYLGELYRTRGSPFNAAQYTGMATVTRVGEMRLRFANGRGGTLTYSVDGVSVTKPIVRQEIALPLMACN